MLVTEIFELCMCILNLLTFPRIVETLLSRVAEFHDLHSLLTLTDWSSDAPHSRSRMHIVVDMDRKVL